MRISDWSSDVCSSDLPYFLTVYDIVQFARSHDILCQGRGSAANSAVCYCLGTAEVDPENGNALDRKSVVLGKSVSVRVDLGGRRIIKKKNRKTLYVERRIIKAANIQNN